MRPRALALALAALALSLGACDPGPAPTTPPATTSAASATPSSASGFTATPAYTLTGTGPLLAGDVLVRQSTDDRLVAVGLDDGTELWTLPDAPDSGGYQWNSQPLAAGPDGVALGYQRPDANAAPDAAPEVGVGLFDAATGEVRWRTPLREAGPAGPLPTPWPQVATFADGVLAVSLIGAAEVPPVTAGLDPATGALAWTRDGARIAPVNPASALWAVASGADGLGHPAALDPATGSVRWQRLEPVTDLAFTATDAAVWTPQAGGLLAISEAGAVLDPGADALITCASGSGPLLCTTGRHSVTFAPDGTAQVGPLPVLGTGLADDGVYWLLDGVTRGITLVDAQGDVLTTLDAREQSPLAVDTGHLVTGLGTDIAVWNLTRPA